MVVRPHGSRDFGRPAGARPSPGAATDEPAGALASCSAPGVPTWLRPGTGALRTDLSLRRGGFGVCSCAVSPKRLPSPPCNPAVRNLVRGKHEWSLPIRREDIECGFRGWHERGYLPHRDEPGLVQFVTFRLADAFPEELRGEWEALLKIEEDRRRRFELEAYLDRGRGGCCLRQPAIARLVEDSLLFRNDAQYELRAWVIMPNHVHVLFKTRAVPMSVLVDAWKGYTAKAANKMLGRKGKFWQEDYWDTYMRDDGQEQRSRRYIENNPVKARLVALRKDWPWGSARFRDQYERLCVPP